MTVELEDILELAAAILVVIAALWAVIVKLWRAGSVINRIVELNLVERLDALLATQERGGEERNKNLNLKRAG